MAVKVDFSSADRFREAARLSASSALNNVAEDLQADVQRSMGTGSRGVASAPGSPPNRQTSDLARSIVVERVEDLRYRVGTNLQYGRLHEFGGMVRDRNGVVRMFPARPFLAPAAARARVDADQRFRRFFARDIARRFNA